MNNSFFKKIPRNIVVYISAVVILILLIASFSLYYVFNKKKVVTIYNPQKASLDSRFFILYGKVFEVGDNQLKVNIIDNKSYTDDIFEKMESLNLIVGNKAIIKLFSDEDKTFSDIKISGIKLNQYIVAYIDSATSSGYKAIGVKVFDQNFIK